MAEALSALPHRRPDDWQVQVHCRILARARVALRSALPADIVRATHLEPVEDLSAACAGTLAAVGRDASLAVLPHGPVTIPWFD